MMDNYVGFSTDNCSLPSNKNIKITYFPKEDTDYYTYQLYKNDSIVRTVTINGSKSTEIYVDSTGKYQVKINRYLLDGTTTLENSCEYVVDKEKPVLNVKNEILTMTKGNKINIMEGVSASDNIDGNINGYIVSNISDLNLNSTGKKRLTYTVSDRAGNSTSKSIYINVVENPSLVFAFKAIIIIVLMLLAAYIIRYCRSLKLEKRVEKFSINSIKKEDSSAFYNIKVFFERLVNKLKPTFEKSVFAMKYSKKYDKYKELFNIKDNIDFIIIKFLVSVSLLFVAALTKAIQFKLIGFYEIWIPLLIGFYLPDILFILKYKFHNKRLENDLLQGIVIMNNAFKSGRSITQAISLVASELEGPIGNEFKRMEMEINLGLSIEEVFRRFAKRVNMEEATYLTASLSIINKTGGNIIRVFDSIEKTLVNKKKLRLELDSLTSGSKIIVNVLFFVPLLFVLFISIVSPGYFAPLFTNPLGILLIILMVLYYIIYIICIRWIMKVRM